MNIAAIKNLYAYQDGDIITPGMGFQIDAGFGLHQYWNPTTKQVIQTDFSVHNATIYPKPYSSKKGDFIVPETTGQQWYYGNISDEGAILQNGVVKAKYASLFRVTTVTANGKTLPALVIINNLATEADHTDKYIYYVSTYNGKQFTCDQLIPIQSAVGDAYDILLSIEGEDGSGDNVLSNDNDWVKYTSQLQLAGQTVASGVNYAFQKLQSNNWIDIVHTPGIYEISGNSIKLFNAAVEGVELFRSVATANGKSYVKTFEVSDIHDPYFIDPGCNIAGDAVLPGQTVTFNPKVYDRASGEVSTGWTFAYTLTKRADGSVITAIDQSKLTYDNIESYGGINVRIEANKN